ncbi:hypothetical protein [Dehalobacterium formicoaceticum]|uniref:hypothetical protein n=1 Tax=Dehalobacterium formicoaceticum TaxID=51515 RepID=UPI0031F60B47
MGYAIKIAGTIDNQDTTFSIGIGKETQAKFNFKVNDVISGECLHVPDPDMEPVDYYKVSKLAKSIERSRAIYQRLGNWYRRDWKFIARGDTGDWLPGLMTVSASAAYGELGCWFRR